MPPRRPILMLALGLLLTLGTAGAARAQGLDIAGSADHLWVLQPTTTDQGKPAVGIYHQGPGVADASADTPQDDQRKLPGAGGLEKVRVFTGRVVPGAVAGVGPRMYFAYTSGAVELARARPGPLKGTWGYAVELLPFLPSKSATVAWTAGQAGPAALVHTNSADALAKIDAKPTAKGAGGPSSDADRERRRELNLALGLPLNDGLPTPDAAEDDEDKPADDAADSPEPPDTPSPEPEASPQAVSADRLLLLRHGRWENQPLPEDWPTGKPAWLVQPRPEAEVPVLLVRPDGATGTALRVYRWDAETGGEDGGGAWSATGYTLPGTGQIAAAAVEGQVVIAQRNKGKAEGGKLKAEKGNNFDVACLVLRGDEAHGIGHLTLDVPNAHRWAMVGRGARALVLTPAPRSSLAPGSAPSGNGDASSDDSTSITDRRPPAGALGSGDEPIALIGRTIDLRGNLGPVVSIASEVDTPLNRPAADYLVFAAIAAMGVMMIFVLWKRDPRKIVVQVPEGERVGELGKRIAAGLIDLAPALAIAMVVYQVGPRELLLRWPVQGIATSWSAMAPGGLAIGIFIVHTGITEWLTGRSLGKFATGLRVAGLAGEKPEAWQILVRNLLKGFDLLAPPLLIMPLLGAHRQRLGDLMARTVVLSKQEDESETP